jgi:cysteine synthase A
MDNSSVESTVLEAIGNTPVIQVENVYAKMEMMNPSGSIKDRAALEMIEAAEREGELKEGYTIVEPSSGNTGISLAMVASAKGYRTVIVMPENMSEERRSLMHAFGAEIVLTSKSGSLMEAIDKAEEIAQEPNTFMPHQFNNPNNVIAQEKTGRELLEQVGSVDAVVAGVGTGGTLMGISNIIREVNPDVKVIAVEPEEAAVMFGGSEPKKVGDHKIQGIGDGFIPKIVDMNLVDDAVTVGSEEAVDMARKLSRKYGLLVGISAGANMLVSLDLSTKFKRIATVLPDRGDRYLSMNLFKY